MSKLKILPKQIRFLTWVSQTKSNVLIPSDRNDIRLGLITGTYRENGFLQQLFNNLRKDYMAEFIKYKRDFNKPW